MIFRRLPFVPSDPFRIWPALHPHPKVGFIFGSGAGTVDDHLVYVSAGEPHRVFVAASGSRPSFLKNFSCSPVKNKFSDMPRWVGFFGFEAGAYFDPGVAKLPVLRNPLHTPTAFFGEFRNVVKFDLKKNETTIAAENLREFRRICQVLEMVREVDRVSSAVTRGDVERRSKSGPTSIQNEFWFKTAQQFGVMVKKAKLSIAAGDIYQANLSLRFQRKFAGDPLLLYQSLCEKNPSPYAALLKMNRQWIVSNSPELLVSVRGRRVRTRPIAGTRPRGRSYLDDRRKKGQLLLSPKERAEHIMLVDLERNDLGRVCRPGTVRVTERFAVERYSHVMHIVSEVEGQLRKNESALSALAALFPGGTITGCPKIKSIEIIGRLEKEARGPFYGSAGFFAWNGDAVFNILIRTALIQKNTVTVQAGAGIVADSRPEREYRETLAKAGALLEAVKRVSV